MVAAVVTRLQINMTECTVVIETPIYQHSFLIRSTGIIFHICNVYQLLLLAGNTQTKETFCIENTALKRTSNLNCLITTTIIFCIMAEASKPISLNNDLLFILLRLKQQQK